MDTSNVLRQLADALGATATVKSVFGDPIHKNGKTVVPIAKVAYVFGGGFGAGKHIAHPDRQGEGGGGGGGVAAVPAGALEITDNGTRFVPLTHVGRIAGGLIAAFAAGVVVGNMFFCRRQRSLRG